MKLLKTFSHLILKLYCVSKCHFNQSTPTKNYKNIMKMTNFLLDLVFHAQIVRKVWTETGTTTPGQRGHRRNGNEEVSNNPQISKTGVSPSYPLHIVLEKEGLTLQQEIQSAYYEPYWKGLYTSKRLYSLINTQMRSIL